MDTISILHAPTEAALAERIRDDLRAEGRYTVIDRVQPGANAIVIALLSPAALNDPAFMDGLYEALDASQWVLPVRAQPVDVPHEIDHLPVVDVTDGYDYAVLRGQINTIEESPGRYPVRVRTPKVRRSNRRTGIVLAALVLAMFVFSTWAIIMFDIEAPREEFEAEDTALAQTRDVLITETMAYLSTFQPRSTEAAEAFPATVDAVSTRVQPFFAGTATAIHDELARFNATPTPAE